MKSMVHIPNRFLTTILIFVIFGVGVFIVTKLEQYTEINFNAINIGLVLTNSIVLLIILSILIELNKNQTKKKNSEKK